MSDFRKRVEESRKKAKETADKEAEKDLDAVYEKVDELDGIFNDLELQDKETYDHLITVVEKATGRNESLAEVVDRLKTLGEAGIKLAAAAGNVTGPGALKMVLKALK
jgi:hypothetical protein